MAWVLLQERSTNVSSSPPGGWFELNSVVLSLQAAAPPVIGGWFELNSTTLNLQAAPPPAPGGWQLLKSISLSLQPALAPGGWQLLKTTTLILKVPAPPPFYEEEAKIPWGPIAIVGGAVLVGAAVSKKKGRP